MKHVRENRIRVLERVAAVMMIVILMTGLFPAYGDVFGADRTRQMENLKHNPSAQIACSTAGMKEASADVQDTHIMQVAQKTNGSDPLNLTASSAIVYCENTGQTIYEKNVGQKEYPYSITKLMTALLVVQKCPLDKKVTVSKDAASQGDTTILL